MDGGTRHVLFAAQQLQIFERAVFTVAVFPPDAMAGRNRAVGGLPHALMNELPIAAQRASPIVGDIGDLVAITVELHRADGIPVLICGAATFALFELRLAHASGRPSWTAQPFVGGDVSFRKAMRDTGATQPLGLEVQQMAHMLRRLF